MCFPRCLLALVFFLLAGAGGALAQTAPTPPAPSPQELVQQMREREWEVQARRTAHPVQIDGHLDEADWEQAEPVGEFFQRERRTVIPATERTEVRVLYDDDTLYIGFRCFDRDAEKLRVRALFRDESGGADDLVAVMLDAYHGHRGAIQFVTNANGLMEDLLQTGETENTRNHNFDAIWTSKGSRNEGGYEVEIAIPFKTLRFEPRAPGEEITFGIGFKRNVPRKNEEVTWPFVSNDSSWYRPSELGHVRGITDVRPGRNIQIRPYALGGGNADLVTDRTTGRREAGVDAKWGVTTGLTADFTLNTDFAQEEVDAQQVNFTRFSLFFPEKRQLFLEGQQVFQFGVPQEADLVFTRRIGLSPAGEAVRLDGGARLSGRQGRTSIGAMSMQTGDAGPLAGQNFSVMRVRRDVLSRSSIGGLVTNVQGGGRANRVAGADANFYFRRVWFLEGWLARMEQTGTPGSTSGYGRFAYDADRYGASYRVLSIGEGFGSDVGFIRRPDTRQHTTELRYSPRPASDLFRQLFFTGRLGYVTDQRSVLETRERTGVAQFVLETGDAVQVTRTSQLEAITAPFLLRSDVTFAPGAYRFTTTEYKFDSFRRRHQTLTATYTTGGFWTGDRDTISLKSSYRFSSHFGVSANYDVNWVRLPEAEFTTHLMSTRVQVAFTNSVAVLSLLQYNRDTRQFSSNVRLRWIPRPGTDFFVVFNELDEDRAGLAALNRSVAVKLNYLLPL